MLQAKIKITTVRMAVARLESIPLTPALASTAVTPANRAESNPQWSQFMRFSKNRAHNTSLYAQCGAVSRRRKRAGHEHNHCRYLVRGGEALQKRTRSYRAEEFLFHISSRNVFRFCHVGDECFH